MRNKQRQNSQSSQNKIALRVLRILRLPLLCVLLGAERVAQPVFRSGTDLVLVNVVVRDKSGAVVRGLTRDDFTITEDDKAQTITTFDFEELDKADAVAAAAPDAPIVLPEK